VTPLSRQARAERLGPYFEAQLRLARRLAELTGARLSETAFRVTNFHRRLGMGVPGETPSAAWRDYAARLETTAGLAAQVTLTQETFLTASEEFLPPPGQTAFGCFAHSPLGEDGMIRIHFYNLDTDEAGGPLAAGKVARRKAELATMVAHIRAAHPQALGIRGTSWLYNLEAYRRLFPPAYGASRKATDGPLGLQGSSSWGQLIDSREAIRPRVRDAFSTNLGTLDPRAPWRVFPLPALTAEAPIAAFATFYAV
jgi:hypothetical protein